MSLLEDAKPNTKQYWRSLDELADKPAFQDWMSREFPTAASELPNDFSRRRWLQLMGASLALGGMSGCRWESEEIAPFTVRPQNRTPGEKQHFSTMWELDGVARPLTVTSIDGRPIKIEGNREHPASRGATTAFDQALILSMYDPDRSTGLLERVRSELVARTWEEFDRDFQDRLADHAKRAGAGLAIVKPSSESPTQHRLLKKIASKFPQALICEPDLQPDGLAASDAGGDGRLLFHLKKAKVIACFDADPLGQHPDSIRIIRDWSGRREPTGDWMNRLYSFESNLSLTGSNADHRVPTKSSAILQLLTTIETEIQSAESPKSQKPAEDESLADRVLAALVNDLLTHRGESIVAVGAHQPAAVHQAALRINQQLGNLGKTIDVVEPTQSPASDVASLLAAVNQKQVETLVVMDANLAYGSQHAAAFQTALKAVDYTVHLGTHRDETARLCRWNIPMAHALESWLDGRTWDGAVVIGQPLLAPLFEGRSILEMMAFIAEIKTEPRDLIRETLAGIDRKVRDDKQWRRVVHDGFLSGSSASVLSSPAALKLMEAANTDDAKRGGAKAPASIELVFHRSRATHDGRFANNGWLQETPDAVSKLTWDNAAMMSPATAKTLQVSHGDVIRIEANGAHLEAPVFELPGVAEGSIQLELGYGRIAAGHVGGLVEEGVEPVGVDASILLPADGSRILTEISITATGRMQKLATTQDHFAIDAVGLEAIGKRVGELVRTGTLAEYEHHPDFAQHRGPHHPPLQSLWEEKEYEGHAWGMAIDLNKCIGCNACMVACQSENNVPVVGKEQVLGGREMHWLRMDRYFAGSPESPDVAHQPVACHHCENAPCEQVCPVAATVHSDEGLNDMVYNRCIGTRYCANNCPYKVRRFNFLDYNAPLEEPGNELIQLGVNPEVTVRSRGVMEKCTYCVQRIQDVKIDAKNERRSILDGEVQSACQTACPAEAIVFGDLNDPDSEVAKMHADQRAYGMLAELNTKPRTKYLAKVRNPHPWLETYSEDDHDDGHHVSEEGHSKSDSTSDSKPKSDGGGH